MDSIMQDVVAEFHDGGGLETVYAKQGDTERVLRFKFMDGITPYAMTNVNYIFWKETYSNGVILPPIQIARSAIAQDGKSMDVTLTKQMTAVGGVARCEVSFYQGTTAPTWDETGRLVSDAKTLTTHRFNLCVEPSVYDDGHISTATQDAAEALVELMIEVGEKIAVIDEKISQIGYMEVAEAARVKAERRRESLNVGGTYVDDGGVTHTNVNRYVDVDGVTHSVSPSDFDGMSFMAVAGYAKDTAQKADAALTAADAAAVRAQASATNAAQSESNALSYNNAAATSAANAATSESNASQSESNALSYKNAAALSATNASMSEANTAQSEQSAWASKEAAKVSEDNAAEAEVNANTYATAAESSKDAAQGFATAANVSAQNAAASESNAATSEANAAASEAAAALSMSNAQDYANQAEGAKDAAAISEANALSYKNAAATSAANAHGDASACATSAADALDAANAAGESESNAQSYAMNAASSATDAATSAQRAEAAMVTLNQRLVITVSDDGNLLWEVRDL